MNTSSDSYKLGFTDYQEGREIDLTGIVGKAEHEYLAGYQDALEQDALELRGANDHA
jgi:hypothetical protein